MKNANQANDASVLKISREFNAPGELVFKMFSEAQHLALWWGPVGYQLSVISLDFRPGGMFHYKMVSEERTMWARFVYDKIEQPQLIEFVLSFSDEKGGITRAPFFDGSWPLEIFNSLAFSQKGDNKTVIDFRSYPVRATELEMKTFLKQRASVNGGMNATFDQLDRLLSALL